MPLAKCPRSGKIFDNSKGPVHPDCMEEEEADYAKVLDHLAKHSRSTPQQISEATGVTIECINRMLHQGCVQEYDLRVEQSKEEEYLDEGLRRAKREAERKAKLLQDLAGVKKPPAKKKSAGGMIHDFLDQKRRT